ncbi:hypothetical protein MJO28_008253 [Puccinia striiformis f. sp. tritici]|uniref:Uncharacterized protein n=1 Tax=Puccinia striiformis f. sp. tritici TaxID=168172 RepID=A0ACC0EAH0_9BASI|nr:hypothetical protein Pst134EA_015678 [Puccinia striiformis f. sp. tritici]KAH9463591.1 hypothetical protein Pst134EA_015678 [Puccinia striiformis f. sp. tritici]KAI7949432.1 hypothetical protein MJO28_008253 [Puccinia striiformis f. sp. tritici]KAI9602604.1 hypothetical protein H4Q26_001895 [Puccinia striiformis f. sp. tritici PST-130]
MCTDQHAKIKINSQNPYLTLLFNFEPNLTEESNIPVIKNRATLIFHGLTKIKCLTDGIPEALQELLEAESDIRSFHNDRHYLETIHPGFYPAQSP